VTGPDLSHFSIHQLQPGRNERAGQPQGGHPINGAVGGSFFE